ncbi:hypothetical protein R3P38DRAFT_2813709 [Favolaschia claudopus]|uniref:Uncharacterized protein n=1 Tax=Favolaschia claudopus TaxID=2862362 RepID=A0AAV9Z5K1_9AGAR
MPSKRPRSPEAAPSKKQRKNADSLSINITPRLIPMAKFLNALYNVVGDAPPCHRVRPPPQTARHYFNPKEVILDQPLDEKGYYRQCRVDGVSYTDGPKRHMSNGLKKAHTSLNSGISHANFALAPSTALAEAAREDELCFLSSCDEIPVESIIGKHAVQFLSPDQEPGSECDGRFFCRLTYEGAFTFTDQFSIQRRRELLNEAPSHKPCPCCALKSKLEAMNTPNFDVPDSALYQGCRYHLWDFVYMERSLGNCVDPEGCFELNQIIGITPQRQQLRIRRFHRHPPMTRGGFVPALSSSLGEWRMDWRTLPKVSVNTKLFDIACAVDTDESAVASFKCATPFHLLGTGYGIRKTPFLTTHLSANHRNAVCADINEFLKFSANRKSGKSPQFMENANGERIPSASILRLTNLGILCAGKYLRDVPEKN